MQIRGLMHLKPSLFSRLTGPVQPVTPNVAETDAAGFIELTTKALISMEKEKEEIKLRSRNVIVTGISSSTTVSDKELFETFCEQHLTVKPRAMRTRRIGKDKTKLCVTLESTDAVDDLLDSSSLLRNATDQKTRQTYFNRDLTKQQAQDAYNKRCLAREKRQHPSTPSASSLDPMHLLFSPTTGERSAASNSFTLMSVLRCFTTNIRSIMNKLTEFQLFVDCHNPDIVALTETWLSDKIPSSLLTGSRPYRVFRCDRSVRHGGGVCLFVRDNFKFETQQVQLPSKFDCLEIIAVDFSDSSVVLPYRIIVAYRPPDYSPGYNDLFFSALDYLANGSGRLCVLGDLNLPDFDWELFRHPDSLLYNVAADLVCNHGLIQLVLEPTRAENILDIVLCSDDLSFDNVTCLPPLGSSDHNIISFSFTLSFPLPADNPPVSSCPNFKLADWASFTSYMSDIDWTFEFSCCASAADMWLKLTDVINIGINNYVPCKSSRSSRIQHFYPSHIRRMYSKKLHAWKLYKTFRTTELLAKYKQLSKICSCSIRQFEANFENKLVDSGNLGAFYKYVNKKLNGSNGIAPLCGVDGNLAVTDSDKAALLNNYFCSVFTADNGIINTNSLPCAAASSVSPPFLLLVSFRNLLNSSNPVVSADPMVSLQSSSKTWLAPLPTLCQSCSIYRFKRLTFLQFGSLLQ
jgi:hypothetical protein